LVDAVKRMHDRLEIVSAERVRAELDKLMVAERPGPGLWFLVDTGLANEFLPELPNLAVEQDPIHRHKDVLAHTIAVVEKNLKLIDQAISESKAALSADPASTFFAGRLNHAYGTKLDLLRSAATLPSRT
ncbi:MAG: hypothetical protein NTW72_02310, partial [Gemmatimonadetes bacterium]|nr:hypothetical protein [Gemmatimonadota bacterium]